MGKPPQIFEKDEVEGMMRTDGSPLAPDQSTRTVALGDVVRDPNTQEAAPPPSLRKEGESLPQDDPHQTTGEMKPVQFPQQKPDDYPDASNCRGLRLPRTTMRISPRIRSSRPRNRPPRKPRRTASWIRPTGISADTRA